MELTQLSSAESERLIALENIIKLCKHIKHHEICAGRALRKIWAKQLFRSLHPTIWDYCQENFNEWGFSQKQGDDVVMMARITDEDFGFCEEHCQQLDRAIVSRSLHEFGPWTDEEIDEAIKEHDCGHYSRKNFDARGIAFVEIQIQAAKKVWDEAGCTCCPDCPVCILGDDTLIDRKADEMADAIKKLPDGYSV